MSHSQGDEERAIMAHFATWQTGTLLDVGASDGATFSNSRALLENGWGGLLIEPEPAAFLRLFELYRHRHDVQLINGAIGQAWDLTTFWRTADLVSTTVEEHFEKWRGTAAYDGDYLVPVVPLEHVLRAYGPFDFVTIDVEGASAVLLPALLEHANPTPRMICIEHDSEHLELAGIGRLCGFEPVYVDANNLILAR